MKPYKNGNEWSTKCIKEDTTLFSFLFCDKGIFSLAKKITSACRNSPLGLKTKTLSLPWKYWSGNTWHQKSYFPGFKMPRISFKIVCKSLSYLVPFERVVWSTGKAGNNSKINSNFLTSLASLIILKIEGRGHRVQTSASSSLLIIIITIEIHHFSMILVSPQWKGSSTRMRESTLSLNTLLCE